MVDTALELFSEERLNRLGLEEAVTELFEFTSSVAHNPKHRGSQAEGRALVFAADWLREQLPSANGISPRVYDQLMRISNVLRTRYDIDVGSWYREC